MEWSGRLLRMGIIELDDEDRRGRKKNSNFWVCASFNDGTKILEKYRRRRRRKKNKIQRYL